MKFAQPYYYYLYPGQLYAYGFITDSEVEYQIVFRPVPFLLPDIPELADLVFELSIIAVPNSTNGKPIADHRVYPTIMEILKEFSLHLPANITLYLSDSSDDRHLIRQRLFNSWFESFEDKSRYIKIEVALDERQPDSIAFTILLQTENPYINKVLESIEQLKNDFRQGS